jgi:hypothetical protein
MEDNYGTCDHHYDHQQGSCYNDTTSHVSSFMRARSRSAHQLTWSRSKMLRFDQITACRRLLTALVASGLMTAPLDLGSAGG